MSKSNKARRVPVTQLCHGLYVVEPDRPWTEVPTPFQGFEIISDYDIEIFQQHCEHVFVDVDRCRPEAIDTLNEAEAGGGTGAPLPPEESDPARPELDTTDAFGGGRSPSTERFERLVREAYQSRSETRRFIESVLEGIPSGDVPDAERGQSAVADLARRVGKNPGVALWLSSLDDKDAPTSVHSVNVCILALTFGVHLGLESGELERIGLGALLHDVGKMSLPPEILEKRDALTDAEWAVARRHPEQGRDSLEQKGGFPREVLEIVAKHHERLDGNGYPAGLSGMGLPLAVRLVGLVNRYDSLVSDRPYRSGGRTDKVLQQLYNDAEGSFGARLVQEFIRCVGIYPPGTLVELDNGAAGVVLGSGPESRIRPTVLLVRSPDGDFYDKRLVVNLAVEAGAASEPTRIRRTLDPGSEGIDVGGIVAIEFGLENETAN